MPSFYISLKILCMIALQLILFILYYSTYSEPESESELLYDWRFTANQLVLGTSPFRLTTSIFFQLNTCGQSWCNILSNERMGLSFTIAAGPRQRSHSRVWLMTTFYCLRFETCPTWRARSPYLYHPGRGWPTYIPRHWVPFSSPPTTRRATVEVFDPPQHDLTTISMYSRFSQRYL
jgi:hypothetical protein